jgi:hypothetical protein
VLLEEIGVDAACREALFAHPDDSLLKFSFSGILVGQPVKCLVVPLDTALTDVVEIAAFFEELIEAGHVASK